jgi:tRNA dimethylallyltransferase
MNERSRPVLIVGPTGVGKTAISIELAGRINAEIISADSRLFYRGMDIGTAKPSLAERAKVPHHLIDIAAPDENLSLATFQEKVREAITSIQARGHLPLLVGGTGQYIRALTENWTPPQVAPDQRLRNELEKLAVRKASAHPGQTGQDWLHERLKDLDPMAAQNIDARNMRRTLRAMEVILTSGRKFSELRGRAESPDPFVKIGLTRPRPALYARIDARIDAMFEQGFLEEIRALLAQGYSPDLPSMSAIGYREGAAVVQGRISVEEAKIQIRRATRVFVRRQANWFKPGDPDIQWLEVGENTTGEIKDYLHAIER